MAGGGRKPPNRYPIEMPSGSVTFDPEAFNEFLNLQGIRLVHHKAMRCPVGMTDVDDNRRPHEDHEGCSNGFIYTRAGIVTAGMQGNGNNQNSNDVGLIESSFITASFPQFYDESQCPVAIAPFDRFYLCEEEADDNILVPTWHLMTAHASGLDKLYYPAVEVEEIIDARGEKYVQGADFTVEKGQIKWGSRQPGFDVETNRGTIYSIRYLYRPYWYCARMLHEIRVAQNDNGGFGENRKLMRMPQQALLAREFTYTNEDADSQAKDANSLRQTPSPNDGGWGAPR